MADGIDSEALGKALATHLAPVMERIERAATAVASRPQEAEKDEFADLVAEIHKDANSEEGKVDITKVLKLLDLHGQKLTKTQQGELRNTILIERANRAKREIDLELDKYAENDELIGAVKSSLKNDIIKEFDTSDEYKQERNALMERDIDGATMKKLIKKHVERIEKAAGKKKDGTESGGTVTKTSTSTTSNKLDEVTGDISKLSTGQQNLYQSHYGLLVRSGQKKEDAHSAALQAALRRKP